MVFYNTYFHSPVIQVVSVQKMKREGTTWNIYELMTWLDKCVDRFYTKKYIEIRNVINDTI